MNDTDQLTWFNYGTLTHDELTCIDLETVFSSEQHTFLIQHTTLESLRFVKFRWLTAITTTVVQLIPHLQKKIIPALFLFTLRFFAAVPLHKYLTYLPVPKCAADISWNGKNDDMIKISAIAETLCSVFSDLRRYCRIHMMLIHSAGCYRF